MRTSRILLYATLLLVMPLAHAATLAAANGEAKPTTVEILKTRSFWRFHVTRATELVRLKSGELAHLSERSPSRKVKKFIEENGKKKRLYVMEMNMAKAAKLISPPPTGWTEPDFDDGDWLRLPGPFGPYNYKSYKPRAVLCIRGRFGVADPGAAGDLALNIDFHGGIVVYLNGRELTRSGLPEGKIDASTPAKDYPTDTFALSNGTLIVGPGMPEVAKRRVRSVAVKIPSSALRKGVNVLGLEVHRAPAPEIMFIGKAKRHHTSSAFRSRLAVTNLSLTGSNASAVTPNTGRSNGMVVRVRNILASFPRTTSYNDPSEPIRTLRIAGARNGAFAGMLLASSGTSLDGLTVEPGDLSGPGGAKIPASEVQVRYALPGARSRSGTARFYGLDATAPAKSDIADKSGGVTQPIWLTFQIPANAVTGDYRGKVTVKAEGAEAVDIPVELNVADWTLPDPTGFTAHAGLIQSPHTLAIKYKHKLWSDEHWRCIEQSFKLLRLVGNKHVFVPVIRRTHLGNEHGMVRWIKAADGSWKHDFSIAEKYIDLAVKHLGKVPVICVYCWESALAKDEKLCFPSGSSEAARSQDLQIRFTVLDQKTGALQEAEGPKWGTPECRTFWKPLFDGIKNILKKHELTDSMMLGVSGDFYPSKDAVDDLAEASGGAKWVVHSHTYWNSVRGQKVGSLASVWGIAGPTVPTGKKDYYGNVRFYGWKNSFVLNLPRGGNNLGYLKSMSATQIRLMAEKCLVGRGRVKEKPPGIRGFGRVGADFWSGLTKAHRGKTTLAGQYYETGWGQLSLNFSEPALLTAGKTGAISNIRYELLRESFQASEARVFIEKALTDTASRAKLGEDAAKRLETMLDQRVKNIMRGDSTWYVASGWRERSRALFAAAAEVSEKLGKK